MTHRQKIDVTADEARQQRDEELRETGSVPEEALTESPDMADVVAESGAERLLPEDVEKLSQRCKDAEKQAEEEHENFIRTLADFNNYRRRTREEMQGIRKLAIEDFALRLLPVLDNFERAIKAAEELEDFDALHGGVVLIMRQLKDVLEKEGIKEIAAEGEQFDPSKHEAVMRFETEECPEHTIVEELQKGYTLGEKILRPSMVKVSCRP